MANPIHPTAVIHPSAQLGENVQIGPYCIVQANTIIGDNTRLAAHVVIEEYTEIGQNNVISSGAVLGGFPQDLAFKGERSFVRVGNGNQIREYVTINRASGEDNATILGDDNFLMAYSHMGHNVRVGNNVIIANAVQIAGYVDIADYAVLGGSSVIHQFCKVGRMAMLGGFSAARQDLPPFSMNDAARSEVQGLNTIGLRRRGLSAQERSRLKKAFYFLFFSNMNQKQAVAHVREHLEVDAYVEELLHFVEHSKRGIARKRSAVKSEASTTESLEVTQALTV